MIKTWKNLKRDFFLRLTMTKEKQNNDLPLFYIYVHRKPNKNLQKMSRTHRLSMVDLIGFLSNVVSNSQKRQEIGLDSKAILIVFKDHILRVFEAALYLYISSPCPSDFRSISLKVVYFQQSYLLHEFGSIPHKVVFRVISVPFSLKLTFLSDFLSISLKVVF